MSSRVIIFDFDGTIADSFNLIVDIFNELAPRFRCRQVTGDDIVRLREATSYDMLRAFGMTTWKMPLFLLLARRRMRSRIAVVQPHAGMKEMLQSLHAQGIRVCILTSNSASNVDTFFRAHQMEGLFSLVISHKKLFGKHNALKKFIDEYGVSAERIVYVGDETRDMEAAKRAGVVSVAVTWGFQSAVVLAGTAPDVTCTTVADLQEKLISLSTT